MDAIIYKTNTGSTEKYAKLLAQKTGLPCYSLENAKLNVSRNASIIYLGWIMAGGIKGYAAASRHYKICAVCAVGIGQNGTHTDSIRKKTNISKDIPLFTLQGNFDIEKLRGIYRIMMKIMVKSTAKSLNAKSELTNDEDNMLNIMLNGGEGVKEEGLSAVLNWYNKDRL